MKTLNSFLIWLFNPIFSSTICSFAERGRIFAKGEIQTIAAGCGTLFFIGDATGQLSVWKLFGEPSEGAAASWEPFSWICNYVKLLNEKPLLVFLRTVEVKTESFLTCYRLNFLGKPSFTCKAHNFYINFICSCYLNQVFLLLTSTYNYSHIHGNMFVIYQGFSESHLYEIANKYFLFWEG